MSKEVVEYIHLPAGSTLTKPLLRPCKIMVLIEQEVDPIWQASVSKWIVDSGCLFMMAWGRNCSLWDDSVDYANLEQFDYAVIPEESFVYTTWHEREPLSEVFFFARVCAEHPIIATPLLIVLDIREEERKRAILALYEAERSGLLEDIPGNPRDLTFRERLKILVGRR